MSFVTIDPATGQELGRWPLISSTEARQAVRRADRAYRRWCTTALDHRAGLLRELARLLRTEAEQHGQLMAREMGKPVAAGKSESEKCAWACDFYADHGAGFLASEQVATDALKSYVAYRPLGVILAIMPWNFPFWQVVRFAAPAVMAGNTVLLKHAPNVGGCAERLEDLFRRAGFPPDVFHNLFVDEKQAGGLIRNPLVRGVTLTGSVAAGKSVARQAGAKLKKTVLELGGSDPYVVLEDADLEAAAAACVTSRLINSGQSCIAAKRFVVVDAARDRFEQLVVERMKSVTMGNPLQPGVELGPQARADLRDTLHRQVTESVAGGARCLLGGQVPEGPGFFYPPTVLTEVPKGTPAYREELFGPVASIIPARNRRAALRIANDTGFGLGAAVFTADLAEGERIAVEELEAGSCFVNAYVRSDPRLPFGGIRDSGYGRELGRQGIREFVNVKTVYVAT